MDVNAIKQKLNKLQSTQKASDHIWKPTPGKHQVRIVPYKFNTDNPFIELYFHYNLNGKTYVSPQTFGNPDPILEFAEVLKTSGDKEEWKTGKSMEPKLRTFLPIIVRGEESEGVKFWGFGKTVYQDILGYIADPDYGDISDPKTGRDMTIEYVSAKDAGTSYPTTTIRVKPDKSFIVDDVQMAKSLLENQVELDKLWNEPSYDELKQALNQMLDPESNPAETKNEQSVETKTDISESEKSEPAVSVDSSKVEDLESQFDEVFSKK